MIQNNQVIRVHPPFYTIFNRQNNTIFQKCFASHVSAAKLHNSTAPSLLEMATLDKHDKDIWTAAYAEEYGGLQGLPCWITVTESQCKLLHPIVGNALSTMAIFTVKHDENGRPKSAKWRIVALGNLYPHEWSPKEYIYSCYITPRTTPTSEPSCQAQEKHQKWRCQTSICEINSTT